MARKRRAKGKPCIGECVYCGRIGPVTDDHVPPKNLFAPPSRVNLLTVPSCSRCNAGFQGDDDYFWWMLSLHHQAGDHPDVMEDARDRVMRALQRPQNRRFLRQFLKSVEPVELRSPAGLYLGDSARYRVEFGRLDRVVRRVVQGLYFIKVGTRVPVTHEVVAFALEGLTLERPTAEQFMHDVIRPLLSRMRGVVGRETFEYWWGEEPTTPGSYGWLLRFYGTMVWIAFVVPKERAASLQAKRER